MRNVGADGKTIIIKAQNQILKSKPTFTVKIYSPTNPNVAPIYKTFTIYISVESVNTTNLKSTVEPGASYNISDLITAQIMPINSDMRNIVYSIEPSCDFVKIIDNRYLQVSDKSKLADGNCQFILKASSEGFSSTQSYSIYVKAENIFYNIKNLSDSNYNLTPMSTTFLGQQMRIEFGIDDKATSRIPRINIKTGSALIENWNYVDGVATFSIVANAASKLIQIEAVLDDISIHLDDIVIYRPLEDISATTNTYKYGKYYISRDNTSENVLLGSTFGTLWTVSSNIGTVDLSNRTAPVLIIPINTNAGTSIKITIFTNDPRCQYSDSFTFYVKELSSNVFKYLVNGNRVSFPYDKDSANKQISESRPQLWVGRSTTVKIVMANGFQLFKYGLTANGTIITMPANASGKSSIFPKITIADGTAKYELNLPEIYAFRPMSGSPSIIGGTVAMTTNSKVIQLTGGSDWDKKATYGIENLVLKASKLEGARFAGGTLYIESSSASETQMLAVEYSQQYNGISISYLKNDGSNYTVSQAVKRIYLDKNGGSGGTFDIIGINDLNTKINSLPNKANCTFKGYSSYSGTQYFDKSGDFVSGRSLTDAPTTLYAQWEVVYNYLTFHESGDNKTITDDYYYWDGYQYLGMNLNNLVNLGYTKLTFNITVQMHEINDGYQELYLKSSQGYNIWENKDIEFSSKNWGTVNYSVAINISDLYKDGSYCNYIALGYSAHGGLEDDWERGYANVGITAS